MTILGDRRFRKSAIAVNLGEKSCTQVHSQPGRVHRLPNLTRPKSSKLRFLLLPAQNLVYKYQTEIA